MAIRWITEADTETPVDPNAAKAVAAASWILYKLTGEKYPGVTERTEWYGFDKAECGACLGGMIQGSENYGNFAVTHRHILYRSTSQSRIRLRGTPVRQVTSVTYGSEILPSTDYWIVNSAYLMLTGNRQWDLTKGVIVDYTAGIDPPEAGKQAAIILANEFILAYNESDSCRLPSNVVSVNRQGVDYTMIDRNEFLNVGRTGIYEIDTFIKAANPAGAKKKPRVFSVDMPGGVTRR